MRKGENEPEFVDRFARIENGQVVLLHHRTGTDALAAGHWPGVKDGRQGWKLNFGEKTLMQAAGVSKEQAGLELHGVLEMRGSTTREDEKIPVVFRSYERSNGVIWFAFPLDVEKWKIEEDDEESF